MFKLYCQNSQPVDSSDWKLFRTVPKSEQLEGNCRPPIISQDGIRLGSIGGKQKPRHSGPKLVSHHQGEKGLERKAVPIHPLGAD